MSEFEDEEEAAPAERAGPEAGAATQLEEMAMESESTARSRNLRALRDAVVALLRELPAAGPIRDALRVCSPITAAL